MIRLSRTGKRNAPHYSIVVTEKTNPASDGNFVEKLGYFNPTGETPVFEVNADRVKHWVSVGARPTETMARLLKKDGLDGMEKFFDEKKQYKKKPKKEPAEEEAPAAPAAEGGEDGGEAAEAPAEAPAEEAAAEAPAEEAPAEEAPAEEAPAEEEKSE